MPIEESPDSTGASSTPPQDSSAPTQQPDSSTGKGSSANSPAADAGNPAEAPKTSLEAVMAALNRGKAAQQSADSGNGAPTSGDGGKGSQGAEGEDEQAERPVGDAQPGESATDDSSEDGERLGRGGSKRIRELATKVKEFAPKAEAWDRLSNFAVQNQLQDSDVRDALVLAALRRKSPEEFLKAIRPLMDETQSMVGNHVPDDLREMVESGEISERAAKELAKERAQRAHSERELQSQREREEAQREERQMRAVADAAAAWERAQAQIDPEYSSIKADLVKDRMDAMLARNGAPSTPEEAVQMCKTALADVERMLSRFTPSKKPIAPPTPSGGANTQTVSQPKNSLEAAAAALKAARQ